jgi:hypothetical protein
VLSLAVRALMQAALGTRTTTAPLLSARFATTRLSPATDSTAQCSSHVAPRARRLFNSAPTVGATLACSRCSDTNPPQHTQYAAQVAGRNKAASVVRTVAIWFSPPSCARYAHESQPQLSHTAAAPSPFIPPLDPSAPLERFRTNAHMPVSQHTSLSPEQFPAVTSPSPRPKPSLTPQHSSRPAKDPKPYLDVCFPTLHPTLPPARQVDPANTYQTGSISCASGCERLKHLNPLSHTPIHRIRRAVAKRYIHVLISQPSTRWLWALLEKSARTGCFHPAAPLLTSYKGSYHPSRSQAACWTTSSSYPTEEAPRAPSLCGGVSAVGRA